MGHYSANICFLYLFFTIIFSLLFASNAPEAGQGELLILTKIKQTPLKKKIIKRNSWEKEVLSNLASIESSNNPKAVSSANAVGLYQIRKSGGLAEYNAWHIAGFKFSAMLDPQKNERVAAWYLFDYLYKKKSPNEFVLALSSYQCGMRLVRAGIVNHTYVRAVLGKESKHYKKFMDKYVLIKYKTRYFLYFEKNVWEKLNKQEKDLLVLQKKNKIKQLNISYFK